MKLFFVHSGRETFVELDRELLGSFTEVQVFYAPRKFPFAYSSYWRGVRSSDLVFCWFASWNSFWALLFAKAFRKPSILVIGGYDLANIPECNYGHQRGGLKRWVSRAGMKLATEPFTNSYYSQKEAEINAGIPLQRVKVFYHGIPDLFGFEPSIFKEQIVLTVGKVDWPNIKRKGLEAFVRTAILLPDIRFILVGAWADDSIDYLRSIASPNVVFTGWVSDEELHDYYRRASVYVQPSLHEGFGLSVAEAMLAGCIPVVTRAGALPEVVGDCGLYCETNSPERIAEGILTALRHDNFDRQRARQRILDKFPIEARRRQLHELLTQITH